VRGRPAAQKGTLAALALVAAIAWLDYATGTDIGLTSARVPRTGRDRCAAVSPS
jgi:hypothetical protein